MRINRNDTHSIFQQTSADLLKGNVTKTAPTQVDQVKDVVLTNDRKHHRTSFSYNKELDLTLEQIIDNKTGKVVKKSHSDAKIDQMVRMKRLVALHVDKKA